jgi:hypothetical protein
MTGGKLLERAAVDAVALGPTGVAEDADSPEESKSDATVGQTGQVEDGMVVGQSASVGTEETYLRLGAWGESHRVYSSSAVSAPVGSGLLGSVGGVWWRHPLRLPPSVPPASAVGLLVMVVEIYPS